MWILNMELVREIKREGTHKGNWVELSKDLNGKWRFEDQIKFFEYKGTWYSFINRPRRTTIVNTYKTREEALNHFFQMKKSAEEVGWLFIKDKCQLP